MSESYKKRVSSSGVVHICTSFNNIIITFATKEGDVVAWASAGSSGFKGSRKSVPYAAQIAAASAAKKAAEKGVKTVEIRMSGPGAGREAAVRAIEETGFVISAVIDVTGLPHNGVKPPKRRRV